MSPEGSLTNNLSNGAITIANSGAANGNVRSTRAGVELLGAARVTGNATAGTTVTRTGSASVGGTITNNALAPSTTLPTIPACGPAYSSGSGITGTFSYNATTGNLSLGGANIATLAAGTYCFNNLTLANSAQLRVSGPVTIKLTGRLNAGGASRINSTTGMPGNLRILSGYAGTTGVSLVDSATAYMVVFAPRTRVNLTGLSFLYGAAVAKSIVVGNSAAIHYDIQTTGFWPAIWNSISGF